MSGWIKLHRKITEHWIWEDPEKLKWWLDLIMMANHEPRNILINNEVVTIDVGERHTSEKKLADRWNCSRKKVSNFLELLEKEEMIQFSKSRQRGTSYKVINYSDYQVKKEREEHQKNIGNRGTNTEQEANSENDVSNSFQNEIKNGEKGTSNKPYNDNVNGVKKDYEEHQKNIKRTSEEHRGNIEGTSEEHRGNINKNYKELQELKELEETTTGKIPMVADYKSVINFYQNNFGVINPHTAQDLQMWVNDLNVDLVLEALKRATENQKNYSYAKGIMKNWEKNNIKTIEDVEAQDVAFNNRRKGNFNNKPRKQESLPDWESSVQDDEIIEDESMSERLARIREMRGSNER